MKTTNGMTTEPFPGGAVRTGFLRADGLLTPLLRQADQRSFRRQRDHVKHDAGLGHHGLAERQRVASRSPRHAQPMVGDQAFDRDVIGV